MPRKPDPAPHGYDDDGVPLAPYGLLADNVTPRKSRRGALPGQRGNGGSRNVPPRNKTAEKQKEALCGLADLLLVTPLAALSQSPQIAGYIGVSQTDALAGDAVILDHFMPPLADAAVQLAETKPGLLAWLDTVEDKAPYLALMAVGAQLAKALVENHMRPNAQLAASGRVMVQMRMQKIAQDIQAQAAAMGLDTEGLAEPAAA